MNLNTNKLTPLIFCSGKGTRMNELTKSTPKPLLEVVDGKSILDFSLDILIELGFNEVFINYSYREDLFNELVKKYEDKIRIELLLDNPPNGQGLLLTKYKSKLKNYENILALNGDSIFNFDVENFYNQHLEKNSAISVLSDDIDSTVKNLICDEKTGQIIGIKGSSKDYFYEGVNPTNKTTLKNNLGALIINTSKLYSVEYPDGFLGIFGEQDIIDILSTKGEQSYSIQPKIHQYLSANTPEELEKIKQHIIENKK